MIKPTVGRIVHYHPHVTDNDLAFTSGEPLGAMVVKVWSDLMVNLTVFDANGETHGRTSVYLYQEGVSDKPLYGYAEWMPYQTGQAAKTEKLQAQLDAK